MVAAEQQPALMLAAALVSRDAGEGHVCLPLAQLRPESFFAEDWQALLLAETAVSDGQQATPLVVYQQRLYLHRMWQSEGKIAQFIQRQPPPRRRGRSCLSAVGTAAS
ncbi:hypothetical protein ACQPT6_10170 [Erwinia amylovora]|uniref:hypothetical protein n=1 Tax=Erwinia amylovora TaxID=552 RepID=UPI003D06586A